MKQIINTKGKLKVKVIILENAYEISKQAAEIYIKQINKDHGSVLRLKPIKESSRPMKEAR